MREERVYDAVVITFASQMQRTCSRCYHRGSCDCASSPWLLCANTYGDGIAAGGFFCAACQEEWEYDRDDRSFLCPGCDQFLYRCKRCPPPKTCRTCRHHMSNDRGVYGLQ